MASTKTTAKGIRISNEAAEYFADKPLNRMVEGLMERLMDGSVEFDGENLKICGSDGVHTGLNNLAEIESMALLSDMSLDDALKEVVRLMNEGILMLSGEGIEVEMPKWAQEFEEACHDRGVNTEKVADAAIKAIKRGQL